MISDTQQISFYILRFPRLKLLQIYMQVHTDENSKKIDNFQKKNIVS